MLPVAIWLVNKQPTLERTIFGLYRITFWVGDNHGIQIGSIGGAQQGANISRFSGSSATRINGFFDNFKSDNCKDLVLATANMPSVVSL